MQNQTNPEPLGVAMAKLVLAVTIIVSLGALFGVAGYLAKNKSERNVISFFSCGVSTIKG